MKEPKKRKGKIPGALVALLLVCVSICVGLFFTPLFHIQEVFCVGNDRIAQEEIIAVAEVPMGKNILTRRLSQIKKRVEEVPMVEEVKVRRIFPNKIKIWIRETTPAAYICQGGQAVLIDIEGRIIEIIEDERAGQLLLAYQPVKIEKEKPKEEEKEKAQEEPTPTATATSTATPEPQEILPPEGIYAAPVVVGIELEKPQTGKDVQSKEREKLKQMMEAFKALDKAKLLARATYMDVQNLSDVILMIEDRLEVQFGTLDNIEYRCRFLGMVIQGKIGATEKAVLDYRGKNLYVRPPEDGKDRVVPKPSKEPEIDEETETEEE